MDRYEDLRWVTNPGEELARLERELERAKDPLKEARLAQEAIANPDRALQDLRNSQRFKSAADVAREVEDARRAFSAADLAAEMERYKRPIQELLGNENLEFRMQEALRAGGDYAHALRDAPYAPGILADAVKAVESPEFRDYTQGIGQASALAERRLGLGGVTEALRVAPSYLEQTRALETAAERILNGQADRVLSEAARLAASSRVHELVRRATREAFVGVTEDQAAPGSESAATLDSFRSEGDVALFGSLTKEQLSYFIFYVFQMMRVVVVALVIAAINDEDWEPLAEAAGGLLLLMEFARAAWEGHDKDDS